MRNSIGKKDNPLKIPQELIFILSVFLIIVLSFFLLIPKISSSLYPQKRQQILNEFIKETEKNQHINAKSFWKFREFYSPGSFVFNKNGISHNKISPILQELGIQLNPEYVHLYFLLFTSPKTISIEALITTDHLPSILVDIDGDPVLTGNNQLIVKKKDTMLIVFIKSISDMKKANGFLDYNGSDKSLVENKYWLVITKVATD